MDEFVEMIGASIILLAIFGGLASPLIALIVGLFYYLKKRLEHAQVMAAIEKGTPFPIKPPQIGPAWIKNLTAGIALLIIAAGIVCLRLARIHGGGSDYNQTIGYFAVALVFFAVGISRLIRGLLQRKIMNQNGNGNGTAEPVSPGGEMLHQ